MSKFIVSLGKYVYILKNNLEWVFMQLLLQLPIKHQQALAWKQVYTACDSDLHLETT